MSAIFHYKASKQQWLAQSRRLLRENWIFRTGDPPHIVKSFVAQILATSKFQPMQRTDGRGPDEIRALNFELNVAPHVSGSVLVSMGQTRVICGVTIEGAVPRCMKEQGVTGGWLTAEYSMLPYSTQTRKPRYVAKGRLDGRSIEIQRLIGRSLRAVVDLEKLGPRTIWVDCDVLQAVGL